MEYVLGHGDAKVTFSVLATSFHDTLYRSASSFIDQLVPNTFLSRFSNSFLWFCLRETSTGPVRQISDHRFRDWEQLLHDSVTVCHLSAVQPDGSDLRPRSWPDRVHTHHATAVLGACQHCSSPLQHSSVPAVPQALSISRHVGPTQWSEAWLNIARYGGCWLNHTSYHRRCHVFPTSF